MHKSQEKNNKYKKFLLNLEATQASQLGSILSLQRLMP